MQISKPYAAIAMRIIGWRTLDALRQMWDDAGDEERDGYRLRDLITCTATYCYGAGDWNEGLYPKGWRQ